MDYGYDTRTPNQRREGYTKTIEEHLAFKRYSEATSELAEFLADCKRGVSEAEAELREHTTRLNTALMWEKRVRDFITNQVG